MLAPARLAFALGATLTACSDGPSGPAEREPETFLGVGGVYTLQGRFDDFRTPNARFAGTVTLRQATTTSTELTGTAAIVLYNGNTVAETYTEVFRATREGERGIQFWVSAKSGLTGSWVFTGELDGDRVSGAQYLDLYRFPGTNSFTSLGGGWTGTR